MPPIPELLPLVSYAVHIGQTQRDVMLASGIASDVEIAEGRAFAEARGWHATYCTSGDAMLVIVFYRGGTYSVYDCTIVRRVTVTAEGGVS